MKVKKTAVERNIMKAELVDDPDDLVRIRTCDDEKWLNAEFRREHDNGLRSIRRQAAIVHRMYDKKMELPEFGGVPYLLQIAEGKLDYEMYYVLRDHAKLLQKGMRMLADEQNRLARNTPYLVAGIDQKSNRMMPPLSMSNLDIDQVFDAVRCCVRDEAQQRAWLLEHIDRKIAAELPQPLWKADKKRHGIHVTKPGFLSEDDLLHALKACRR